MCEFVFELTCSCHLLAKIKLVTELQIQLHNREFTAQDSLKLAIEFVVSLTLSILLFLSLFVPMVFQIIYGNLQKPCHIFSFFPKPCHIFFLHKFSFFSLKTCQSLAINFIFLHTFSFFATRNLQKSCHKFCFFDKFF